MVLRSVSNSSVEMKNRRFKQLSMKSFKLVSLAFGGLLLAFGGYSLGL